MALVLHHDEQAVLIAVEMALAARFDVARCTVARLMQDMGLEGAVRGKTPKTAVQDKKLPCPLDKVSRQFQVPAPNMLWVSDFTYVATWKGFVYVAFVIDAYLRNIGISSAIGTSTNPATVSSPQLTGGIPATTWRCPSTAQPATSAGWQPHRAEIS